MRPIAILLIILAYATPAIAQMSAQEAADRLADKLAQEKAAAVAATQPSGATNADVEKMQKMIQNLAAQNAQLMAIINNLQQQVQANQPAQNSGPNFAGETEPRVGMTMADVKRLPYVGIDLISENTNGTVFRVSTGRINDYGQRVVEDLPSTIYGPQYRTQNVIVGTHPSKVHDVTFDASTGRIIEVDPDPNY